MFKRLKSRKGLWFPGVWTLFSWVLGTSIIAAVLTYPQHRIKRANEKCVEVENISAEDCSVMVDGMTADEVLAYIKDDEVPEEPSNFSKDK